MEQQRPETSIHIDGGGRSQVLDVTTGASAPSATIPFNSALVTPTVAVFVRRGSAPVAVADSTDMYLPAGVPMRVTLTAGDKLAFRAVTEAGKVYITPGA